MTAIITANVEGNIAVKHHAIGFHTSCHWRERGGAKGRDIRNYDELEHDILCLILQDLLILTWTQNLTPKCDPLGLTTWSWLRVFSLTSLLLNLPAP